MDYYSAMKRNELINTTVWVNFKHMLDQRSQTQRLYIIWFHLYEIQEHAKLIYAIMEMWRREEKAWKEAQRSSPDEGSVLHVDLDGGYTGFYNS